MERRRPKNAEARLLCDASVVRLPRIRVRGASVVGRLRRVMADRGLTLARLAGDSATRRERFHGMIRRGTTYINETDLIWLHERWSLNPLWVLFGIEPMYIDGRQHVVSDGGEVSGTRGPSGRRATGG